MGKNKPIYSWEALDGRLDLGKKFNRVATESDEFWLLSTNDVNAHEKAKNKYFYDFHKKDQFGDPIINEDLSFIADNTTKSKRDFTVNMEYVGTEIVAKGHNKDAQKYFDAAKKTSENAASVMRGMKNKKPPEQLNDKEKFIDHGLERFAKWAEEYGKVYADPKGNLTRVFADNAYLGKVISKGGSLPKFGRRGDSLNKKEKLKDRQAIMEKNMKDDIALMGDLDLPPEQRGTFFDDYMDMMDGSLEELRVEFDRQKMEAAGWDANKEKTHLQNLRAAHTKVIEAFDKIKLVENEGAKYNDVLNNDVPELVGAKSPQKGGRAMAMEIGYMKAEIRAMDKGYPSNQLFVLGNLGAMEGGLEEFERYWKKNHDLKLARKEQIPKELEAARKIGDEKQIKLLESEANTNKQDLEYYDVFQENLKAFNEFKNEIEAADYKDPESTLETYRKIKEFADKHPFIAPISSWGPITQRQVVAVANNTKEMKAFETASNQFNTQRSGKESEQHKALREASENLVNDLRSLKAGIHLDGPNKGELLTDAEKDALRQSIVKQSAEVEKCAEEYAKTHPNPWTSAGKKRKAGAESLKQFASEISKTMKAEMEAVIVENENEKSLDNDESLQNLNSAQEEKVRDASEVSKTMKAEMGAVVVENENEKSLDNDEGLQNLNSAREEKVREVLGDTFDTYNAANPANGENNPFYGEKYASEESRAISNPLGYSVKRTAAVSISIMAMAASGKYTMDDIMDPTKCVADKAAIFEQTMENIKNAQADPKCNEWIAQQIYNGKPNVDKMLNEASKNIDFSNPDILKDKTFCQACHLGAADFDAWQEMAHCKNEIVALAQKDHPEINNYNAYKDYCSTKSGPFSGLNTSIDKLQKNSINALVSDSDPMQFYPQALSGKACLDNMLNTLNTASKDPKVDNVNEWYAQQNREPIDTLTRAMADMYATKGMPFIQGNNKLAQASVSGIINGSLTKDIKVSPEGMTGIPKKSDLVHEARLNVVKKAAKNNADMSGPMSALITSKMLSERGKVPTAEQFKGYCQQVRNSPGFQRMMKSNSPEKLVELASSPKQAKLMGELGKHNQAVKQAQKVQAKQQQREMNMANKKQHQKGMGGM